MKKIILCIFLVCVTIFYSPFKSYAEPAVTVEEIVDFVKTKYTSQTFTSKYAVFYETSNVNSFVYVQWSENTDEVNLTGSNTGINLYIPVTYTNGNLTSNSYNNNDISSVLYNWLRNNTFTPYGGTVTVKLNGSDIITPSPTVENDGFFAYKDDYVMQFGTYCTESSTVITDTPSGAHYYTTDLYWFDFSIPYNGSTLTYRLASAYYMKYISQFHVSGATDSEGIFPPSFTYYVQKSAQSYSRGIRAYTTNTPQLIGIFPTDFDKLTDYRSLNRLSLRQLCTALQDDTPDLTLDDLFTEITITAVSVSDRKIHYTQILDYSSLSGSVTSDDVPLDSGSDPDQTQEPDVINEYFNSMVGYMDGILYGTTFNPPSDKTGSVDMSQLSEISMPDVDLTLPELDSEPLTWFGSFVEWWYSSPFGLVAIAALTFLIIRTIIW